MSSVNMAGEITPMGSLNQDVETAPTTEKAPQKRAHYLEVENVNPIPLWLGPCHLVAALFHCMQALILFGFSKKVKLNWLIYTNYPAADDEAMLPPDEYAIPDPTQIASYSVTIYAGLFILMSGINHTFCTLPGFRQRYEYLAARNRCPSRWWEYSASNALMKVLIAQVSGVTDMHILILLFALNFCVPWFALLFEYLNAKARADGYEMNWIPFFCGLVPHLTSWGVIFSYFFTGFYRGESPPFVSAICGTLFFLDLTFPTTFLLTWKQVGIFKNYMTGEFTFILLSFTSKTLLAWIALGGALNYAAT